MKQKTNSEAYNIDCMELMAKYPDKYFDLAVVDPPYGIKEDGESNHSRGGKTKFGGKFAKSGSYVKHKLYTPKNWDKEPATREYFQELIRVSKHQIIWGANHFISRIPYDSRCWIVWDKDNGGNDFADCELAWTSFNTAVRRFKFRWAGMLQGNMRNKEYRIHPTQKPVVLYDWIYQKYLPNGGKVLDTHLGSGSNRIAAYKAGNIDFIASEIDKEYFEAQEKRFSNYKMQLRMF